MTVKCTNSYVLIITAVLYINNLEYAILYSTGIRVTVGRAVSISKYLSKSRIGNRALLLYILLLLPDPNVGLLLLPNAIVVLLTLLTIPTLFSS